jgi:transposase
MREAVHRLAVAAPVWLQAPMQPAWGERDSHRVENDRFPTADAARQQLATTIGADGLALLQAAYAPDAPPEVRDAPAVEVLRQIWLQQY